MDVILAVLSVLGLKLKIVVASAIGSFISLTFFEGLKFWERFVTFLGGLALGSYTTGVASDLFELTTESAEVGVAILIAMFGMSLAAAVIKVVKETKWSEIIRARIGGVK